jgi:hypothetical protein
MNLAQLLGDVTPDRFFAEYWGRKPLRIRRTQPGFYRPVLTLSDIDHLLFSGHFRPGEYRLSRAGEGTDLQFHNVSAEDPTRPLPMAGFFEAFQEGKSIVLHGADQRWPALAEVVSMLERSCACNVTANLYLTPAAEQAYPLHLDTHDFFIFQFHGSKHWKIFAPNTRSNPIRDMPVRDGRRSEAGPLIDEFDLDDGDLLYVPRGFFHEVVNRDQISLHATVGLHGLSWYGAATAALGAMAVQSDALRGTVPVIPQSDGSGEHNISNPPFNPADLDLHAGIAYWRRLSTARRDPLPDGHFASLERAANLTETTPIRRRRGALSHVWTEAGNAHLNFAAQTVTRPETALPAFHFLTTTAGPFTPADIPGPTDKTALVHELLTKGFLTAVDEQESTMQRQDWTADRGVTPMSGETTTTDTQAGHQPHCDCQVCSGGPATRPDYVYSIGKISARFPSVDIEKELYQAVRTTETEKLTDRQVLHQVLSQAENAYLAREMCWVFSVNGVETFIVIPRSGLELNELVAALGTGSSDGATCVILGQRTGPLPGSACAGLTLPGVIASKIYSFNIDELVKSLPLEQTQVDAGKELLGRITHLIDNVGDSDEHRAVNYLALRYPAMYSLVVESFGRDFSLQGLGVRRVSTRSTRNLIDVQLNFVSRKTDVRESYAMRVDVSGMFPFLVSPAHPVFDKDN